jgi:hypothetical protein
VTASGPGEIEVENQLEWRIRKPVDMLRCVLSCAGIVALAVAGIAASATTSGVETDIVGATHRLPHALLVVAPALALFALFVLPVAMAVQLRVRSQFRRLAEAVATGVLAAAVTVAANVLLAWPTASQLYFAIIMARPGTSHAAALDPYLAGLVAYATMIGLAAAGLPVTAIQRGCRYRSGQGNPSRHYAATIKTYGCRLDVVVYDRGPAGGRRDVPAVPKSAGARAGVT